jgi:phage shock protein PspC (stress-responsive transcriptional regulator)
MQQPTNERNTVQSTKLYRSTSDTRIAGVAGGIADHFGTDPTLVRAIFLALALCGGAGLVIYLILWITVPKRPVAQTVDSARSTEQEGPRAA